MLYTLSEEEYQELLKEQRHKISASRAELQELCIKAAMFIPITREWSPDEAPRPWGCILEPKEQDPGYCDNCPARKVCPYDGKEYSK